MWGKPATYQIPISFLSKELDGKSPGITSSICRSLFSTDRRESNEDRRFLADFAEKVGAGQVGDIIRDLEHTVCTSTLGVHNTSTRQSDQMDCVPLRNTFTVKVSKQVNQVEILQKKGA